jgi:DNA-binding MarR family transcriptional regulator
VTASPKATSPRSPDPALSALAQFRYQLRKFLRFSERAARTAGITPLQHQLLLGVAGFTEHGFATLSELSEFLQERHNSVVALVDRAVRAGLVRRHRNARDRRVVNVELTPRGRRVLSNLTRAHQRELDEFRWGEARHAPASRAHSNRGPARSRP